MKLSQKSRSQRSKMKPIRPRTESILKRKILALLKDSMCCSIIYNFRSIIGCSIKEEVVIEIQILVCRANTDRWRHACNFTTFFLHCYKIIKTSVEFSRLNANQTSRFKLLVPPTLQQLSECHGNSSLKLISSIFQHSIWHQMCIVINFLNFSII